MNAKNIEESQYFSFLRRQEVMILKGLVEELTLDIKNGNSSIVTRRKGQAAKHESISRLVIKK